MAVFLAALSLFAAAASAIGVICLASENLYEDSVDKLYEEEMAATRREFSVNLIHRYATLELGNIPENYLQTYHNTQVLYNTFEYGQYFYVIRNEKESVVESTVTDDLAEAAKYAKEQEAAGIRAVGEAEAAAIAAKGIAEAEAIERKAIAMQKYGDAAKLEMIVDVLPAVAREVASPMANIDSVKIIGGDAQGVGDVAGNVPVVMAKVFESVEEATGIDLTDIVRGQGEHAKITRNINLETSSPQAAEIVGDILGE